MTVKSVKAHQSVWESDTGIYEPGTVQKVARTRASLVSGLSFATDSLKKAYVTIRLADPTWNGAVRPQVVVNQKGTVTVP